MTKRSKYIGVILWILCLLTISGCCEVQYSNPPATFQDANLVGTWEMRYGWGVDTLIIRADGTFRQIYTDNVREGYTYETRWNEWWVERFPDGRVRLHLEGARFYRAGLTQAEKEGIQGYMIDGEHFDEPMGFYDPIGHEAVLMVNKLVLNVQSLPSGELVLLHMLESSEDGFVSYFTGRTFEFHLVETSSPTPSPRH